MATTKPKTKKLVYEQSKLAVKQNDKHTLPDVGIVTVENIHASKRKHGQGKITLKLPNGTLQEFPPAVINAIWLKS